MYVYVCMHIWNYRITVKFKHIWYNQMKKFRKKCIFHWKRNLSREKKLISFNFLNKGLKQPKMTPFEELYYYTWQKHSVHPSWRKVEVIINKCWLVIKTDPKTPLWAQGSQNKKLQTNKMVKRQTEVPEESWGG